jgi:hypothetical protein
MLDKPPENIVYFYTEYQDTFGEIQNLMPGIKFVQGLPDDILDSINPETRNLCVNDDFMGEKDGVISKLFTKKSHGNLSVIYIVQNLLATKPATSNQRSLFLSLCRLNSYVS